MTLSWECCVWWVSASSVYILFYCPREWGKTRALSSEYNLTKLILQTGCPCYHRTSSKKSAPIQKHPAQIPKPFNQQEIASFFFSVAHSATPRPTLGLWQEGRLTQPMLITSLLLFRPEGHQEPHNKVGSQSPAECISGIRIRNLPIQSLSHNPTVLLTPKKIKSYSGANALI